LNINFSDFAVFLPYDVMKCIANIVREILQEKKNNIVGDAHAVHVNRLLACVLKCSTPSLEALPA
jgi:hypothetical protein